MTSQKQIFSKNVQALMDKYSKTRYDVCNDIGIPYTTFSNWLQGNSFPRINQLQKLADYFLVSVSDLVTDFDKKEETPVTTKEDVIKWIQEDATFNELTELLSVLAKKMYK